MQPTHTTIPLSREAHLISSFWIHPGAPIGVQVNTMVLAGREPAVFDTGVAADRDRWLAAVGAVVDPDDVRWIVLSHDDADHVGNLAAAMEAFPRATVVANWFIAERLTGTLDVDPRRQRWVGHGESLDIGDRTLRFDRPPLFDSPTTRGVLDPTTGLYWAGDLGVAPGPAPVPFAEDVPAQQLAESFVTAHQWNSPWYALLDEIRYQAAVSRFAGQGIRTWASTHGPVYRGVMVERAVELLRLVPTTPPNPQPGQPELDGLVTSLLVGTS